MHAHPTERYRIAKSADKDPVMASAKEHVRNSVRETADDSPRAARRPGPQVHPTAIIDPSARLGDGVVIGPYCVIGPNVVIGEDTALHNHVAVQSHTVIGRENVVFPFSVLGADPQDRKFKGEATTLVIGD